MGKSEFDRWRELGAKLLKRILKKAEKQPILKKNLPQVAQKNVELVVVDRAQMIRINFAWRAKKVATDVLSFPTPELFYEQGQMGELIVCLPVMKRQAREQRHPAERELEVLLVHGLLHLMGFDHELGERHAKKMRLFENALLGAAKSAESAGLISRVEKSKVKRRSS